MISKSQIKYIQSLHLKKFRQAQQLFIAEGVKIVSEFIDSPAFRPLEVFATAHYLSAKAAALSAHGIKYTEVSEDELKKISLQTTPNQVLAICPAVSASLDASLLKENLTLYLDDIKDPGNLGTIIRIADWYGIPQVVCSLSTVELYNAKTIQATMGAMLRVSVVYAGIDELLEAAGGITVYAAVLNGENIYNSKWQNGILVIGNEANGISEAVLAKVGRRLTIPAAHNNGSESLNAAVATAILCSEFSRHKLMM